jgi:hypothetical protein
VGVLLWFAHESSAAMFVGFVGLFAVLRQARPLRVLTCLIPAAAVTALVLAQALLSRKLAGPHMQSIGSYFGWSPVERILLVPGAIYGGNNRLRLALICSVSLAGVLASVLTMPRRPRRLPWRVRAWRLRYVLAFICFFAAYLTFPMGLGGTTLLAYRFLPGVCACVVVACAHRVRSLPLVALAAAAPFVMLGIEAHDFGKAEVSFTDLDAIIAQVPRNVAVAQLDLTPPRRNGNGAPVPGAPGRILSERGGRMLFGWTNTPPNPVFVPEPMQWNESVERLAPQPYALLPAFDLRRYSYLVARSEAPALFGLIAQALAPEADLVAVEGEWALFRSRLPTVPLTSPDEVPAEVTDTLARRVNRLIDEKRAAGQAF